MEIFKFHDNTRNVLIFVLYNLLKNLKFILISLIIVFLIKFVNGRNNNLLQFLHAVVHLIQIYARFDIMIPFNFQ